MSDPLFGWDLTFKTVEKDVRKKADVLVSFTHFNLVKRGFRCIGVGDSRTLSGDETATELLPSGWNEAPQYSLRYTLDGKLYILNALTSDGSLLLNLMKAEDLAVSSLAFNIDDTVKATSGTIDKLMPEYKEVMHKLRRDVIDNICEKSTTTSETQTREPSRDQRSSLLVEPQARRDAAGVGAPLGWPERSPLQIGRSDLDPFAPGGGGMIYDPFSNRPGPVNPGIGVPGGLPRGSIPPGARFDPFGPPDFAPNAPRRQPPPDSDEFMPPGSMFM